jgi:hypothetical protein
MTETSRTQALRDAAFEPELFQRIRERFPHGQPSEAALRSYFVREEFTDAAIPSAIKAYLQTCEFLEELNVNESYSHSGEVELESQDSQRIRQGDDMRSSTHEKQTRTHQQDSQTLIVPHHGSGGPKFTFENNRFWLGGVIATKQEAEKLIAYLNAFKDFLPDEKIDRQKQTSGEEVRPDENEGRADQNSN